MRIGVISDTHIPKRAYAIPQQVLDAFAGVDLILHAGDLVVPGVIEELSRIAPVHAVAGNNDTPDLVAELGLTKELDLAGYRICLTHGHVGTGKSTVERALSHFPGAHCVVFGHSHIPYQQWHGTTLAFNPGSATDRRRAPHCSYGMLYLEPGGLRAEIHDLS
ncbi:MAG TPA: metallophosphoesterase family protein [Symbiobacteriaceae bacterium]|nr:metallophosphoesterase family protein [Symbiobacteriaceae bacterium]